MGLDNGEIATLVSLGFSTNQAKVYLALVTLGAASAKNVGTLSGVSREEVYRKLSELRKLGFIENFLTKPATYRAVSLECVVKELLRRKAESISKLQMETEELLNNFAERKKKTVFQGNNNHEEIILIPEQRPILERAKIELKGVKSSLDTICSWDKGIDWLRYHHHLFLDAMNRNVKIRFILQENESEFPEFLDKLQRNPLFQIRLIKAMPPACISLYDQKILLIDILAEAPFVKSPVLLSTNPSIVGMGQIYFDTMWTKVLK